MGRVTMGRVTTWLVLLGSLTLTSTASAADGDADRGKTVYDKHCEQCHGAEGKGDGPGAQFMFPRPRIFKDNAVYKFRKSSNESIPTDEDLYRSITEGMPGTAMPDFKTLSDQERWDLVAFIKSLTEEFADPEELETAVPVEDLANLPERPEPTPESIEAGKQVFIEAKCAKCHSESGRGNGVSWPDLFETPGWGKHTIFPANLSNQELFHGGSKPEDIFRTITTGLRGTPMPEFASNLDAEKRWHLVNYILSLAAPPAMQPGDSIVAKRVATLPAAADDPGWSAAPAARLRTFPNLIELPRLYWQSVHFVTVQALFTDQELALRIRWDDRSKSEGTDVDHEYQDRDGTIYHGTGHPDQLAVQFPARISEDGKRPYVAMGDRKRPVDLWWWRSDQSAVVEMSAKGTGKISRQPEQAVNGEVTYEDGRYTMVVRRSLVTGDTKNDVQFVPGAFVPISVNVWDGDRGELGKRRALTAWYWLYLEPPVPTKAYVAPPVAFIISLVSLLGLVWWTRRNNDPEEEVAEPTVGNETAAKTDGDSEADDDG